MLKLNEIIETSNRFKIVPKNNAVRSYSASTVDEQKIELLKELIKDIEEQRCAQGCVPKSQSAPAQIARYYYKGMIAGVHLALRIINERISRIQSDSNSTKPESNSKEV